MASTTWVARESGRLERCGLGVHGAGNQALWHQRRVLHPGVNLRMSLAPAPGWPPRTFSRRHERCTATAVI